MCHAARGRDGVFVVSDGDVCALALVREHRCVGDVAMGRLHGAALGQLDGRW